MRARHGTWSSPTLFLAILAAVLLTVPGALGQEKKETAAEVNIPKQVMDALKARFPKAVIDKQGKEMEEGREVYDFEFRQDGMKFEADIFADGTILNWEKAIAAKDLPSATKRAVEEKYPKSTIKQIMAVTAVKQGKEALEGYEILLDTAGKQEVEVTIAPDGKILEESSDED